MQRQPDLFQVVRTTHPTRRFASGLHGGQQQTDENANDGDDDEKFDERKSASRHPSVTTGHTDRQAGHGMSPAKRAHVKEGSVLEKRNPSTGSSVAGYLTVLSSVACCVVDDTSPIANWSQ